MPPVIGAVASFLGIIAIPASVLGVAVTYGNIAAGLLIVGSAAEARRKAKSQAAAARNAYYASLQDRSVMIRSAIAPRNLVYGVDKVSGPLADAFTTEGPEGQLYLHLLVCLAGRAVDGIPVVYFNEWPINEADIDGDGFVIHERWSQSDASDATDTVTTSAAGVATLPRGATAIISVTVLIGSGDGTVRNMLTGWAHTSGSSTVTGLPADMAVDITYSYASAANSRVRIHKFLGDHGSVPAHLLAETNGRRTAAHVGHGVAWLWVRLEWDDDVFGQVGMPNISALVRGHRVWDPRTSTTAWTDNAALCTADYVRLPRLGLGCTAEQMPDAEVAAEASICDELVPLNAAGTTTQRRYTCNGALSLADGRLDNFDALLESMAGSRVWLQGRWRLRAGAHPMPEPITLTMDHLAAAPPVIQGRPRRRELFNAIAASYRDPSAGYTEVQAPPVTNPTYEAEDGGRRITRNMQLGMVQDAVRAQRLCKIALERARQSETITLSTNVRAYNLAPGHVVPVTVPRYGWNSKLFEVVRRSLDIQAGTVQYTLRATHPSVWDWAYGEATAVDPAPNTQLPDPFARPPAPASLTLTTGTATLLQLRDGTLVARVRATWPTVPDRAVASGGYVTLQWRTEAMADWVSEPALPGTATTHTIGPLVEGQAVIVRVRATNAMGRASYWFSRGIVVVGKSAPPSNVAGAVISVAAGVMRSAWDACPDVDYQATEVRTTDAHWGMDSPAPLWRGQASELLERVATAGTYTRYVRHLDTGWRPSAATAVLTQVVGAGDLAGGEPVTLADLGLRTFRVSAVGYGALSAVTAPIGAGIYNVDTGAVLASYGHMYRVAKINRATGVVTDVGSYDTLSYGATAPAAMAGALNSIGNDHIVVVFSFDEPATNRDQGGLPAAMYRCGASRAVFGSPNFRFRGAYILIGIPGCGEGNGFEQYAGDIDSDPGAWCDVAFTLRAGNVIAGAGSANPRALSDYGYTGDLNATNGAPVGTMVGSIPAANVESVAGAQAKANAAAATAQTAAQAYAAAQAAAADVNARAYADGIVSDEEARAIADATTKANDARVAAEAAAAADATAKANAARATAEANAAAYAAAQAAAADVSARAYADGIVSDEEARAIADATAKANDARVAAETAAAADATAKANAAALTSLWSGVTGTGRPENNATVGATFGANVKGPAPSVAPVLFAGSKIWPTHSSITQGFTLSAAGLVSYVNGTNIREAAWHLGGSPSVEYWVELTVRTGPAPSGGASVGVPVSLSSDVGWSWTQTGVGTTVIEGSYTILAGSGSEATVVGGGVFSGRLTLISSA